MRDGKIVLAEVGVGPLDMSFGALHWNNPGIHVLLFEPHPVYATELKAAAGARSNVELFNVAIGDENGQLELSDEGTSSSLSGVASPLAQQDRKKTDKVFTVDVRKISDFDKGDIDYLRVDTEGAEWFCLKHLISRPREIVVEMYTDSALYINPHFYEIEEWAAQNNYKRVHFHDSDFIYARQS